MREGDATRRRVPYHSRSTSGAFGGAQAGLQTDADIARTAVCLKGYVAVSLWACDGASSTEPVTQTTLVGPISSEERLSGSTASRKQCAVQRRLTSSSRLRVRAAQILRLSAHSGCSQSGGRLGLTALLLASRVWTRRSFSGSGRHRAKVEPIRPPPPQNEIVFSLIGVGGKATTALVRRANRSVSCCPRPVVRSSPSSGPQPHLVLVRAGAREPNLVLLHGAAC